MRPIALFMALLIVSLPVCLAGELNLVYDDNGNLVTGDSKYRVYNSLNQLWKVYNGSDDTGDLLQEYVYHPTEERILVKKTYTGGVLSETVYYVDENYVRVVNSSGSFDYTYVKHEGQLVAQKNPDGSKYFIHGDHIGSSTVVTDSSGDVVENTTYAPFGSVVSGGTASRFGYEGKEHDSVVGDTDFHFRKYKSDWGLFTQPDSLIQNVYDPQSLNRYMFERGNPYGNVDEDGHLLGLIAAFIGFSAVIGVIAETSIQISNTGKIYSPWRVVKGGIGSATGGAVILAGCAASLWACPAISGGVGIYGYVGYQQSIEHAQSYANLQMKQQSLVIISYAEREQRGSHIFIDLPQDRNIPKNKRGKSQWKYDSGEDGIIIVNEIRGSSDPL